MANDEILTVKEAAELLKISTKTCYDWTHIEGFPCVKIGNCSRIPGPCCWNGWSSRRGNGVID